jgi:hypothetical protein
MFRIVFWDILPCKMIVDRRFRGTYCISDVGARTHILHVGLKSFYTAVYPRRQLWTLGTASPMRRLQQDPFWISSDALSLDLVLTQLRWDRTSDLPQEFYLVHASKQITVPSCSVIDQHQMCDLTSHRGLCIDRAAHNKLSLHINSCKATLLVGPVSWELCV